MMHFSLASRNTPRRDPPHMQPAAPPAASPGPAADTRADASAPRQSPGGMQTARRSVPSFRRRGETRQAASGGAGHDLPASAPPTPAASLSSEGADAAAAFAPGHSQRAHPGGPSRAGQAGEPPHREAEAARDPRCAPEGRAGSPGHSGRAPECGGRSESRRPAHAPFPGRRPPSFDRQSPSCGGGRRGETEAHHTPPRRPSEPPPARFAPAGDPRCAPEGRAGCPGHSGRAPEGGGRSEPRRPAHAAAPPCGKPGPGGADACRPQPPPPADGNGLLDSLLRLLPRDLGHKPLLKLPFCSIYAEDLLLIALILVLMEDECDETLLLSLFYILVSGLEP